MSLREYGGSYTGLDNQAHFSEMLSFWAPGQARTWHPAEIDWLRTTEDLCRLSDSAPAGQGSGLDGQHFGLIVFKTVPRSSSAST